jgi:hypothetical protein
MRSSVSTKRLLGGILSGTYTPLDLREFVQLCYTLALPLIRKKIALGKLNLESVGLNEADVVYDCLADLFQRDEAGGFPQIRLFFERHPEQIDNSSDDDVLVNLRALVFGKVNNNIIRLYSEVDPVLGKILRNMKLAVERNHLFQQVVRFGEVYLTPHGVDALWALPPMPYEFLQQQFSRTVLVYDNIPVMLKKLHDLITQQNQYQRSVPVVAAAVLFKEIYALGQEPGQVVEIGSEPEFVVEDVLQIIENVCSQLRDELYATYVVSKKCSQELFGQYIRTVRSILMHTFVDPVPDGLSYFESLKAEMPSLTKGAYAEEHRTILEYIAKVAKARVKEELRRM